MKIKTNPLQKKKKKNYSENIQDPFPGQVGTCAQLEKQQAESSHGTLEWQLPLALAEKVERPKGSDLCVMVRVSGWSVGRRCRVGFDPPALHVRDELIWDLG